MKVAIIGHGPSMMNSNMGSFIDSYDIVIRQKPVSYNLVINNFKDFGKKTDIICGSWTVKGALKWHNTALIWTFIDARHEFEEIIFSDDYVVLPDLCNTWNKKFRDMRTDTFNFKDKVITYKTSDTKGTRHMSCGLHTILYTCELLKPKTISLFGFDNVKNGNFTWSLTRGKTWAGYADHRWDTEHHMLNEISKKYSVCFEFYP